MRMQALTVHDRIAEGVGEQMTAALFHSVDGVHKCFACAAMSGHKRGSSVRCRVLSKMNRHQKHTQEPLTPRFLPFEVREKCVPCFAIQVQEQVAFPLPPFTV